MTAQELAAFYAGMRHAADVALIAAIGIELRQDAHEARHRGAMEALRGLAEGLKDETRPPQPPNPFVAVMGEIARDPATAGTASCPTCAGRLRWMKDAINGHIHAECETDGCLRMMQ